MIFINADVFHTMLVKQSETRASVLSDGRAPSMILPTNFASGLPTHHHVMKWDRVSGLNSKSQIFNCFMSRCLSQRQAEDSIISRRHRESVWANEVPLTEWILIRRSVCTVWLMSAHSERWAEMIKAVYPFLPGVEDFFLFRDWAPAIRPALKRAGLSQGERPVWISYVSY